MEKNIIHELGHAFLAGLGTLTANDKRTLGGINRGILLSNPGPNEFTWQQHPCPMEGCNTAGEIFADMFIAYVYGNWSSDPRQRLSIDGAQTFMNGLLPTYKRIY